MYHPVQQRFVLNPGPRILQQHELPTAKIWDKVPEWQPKIAPASFQSPCSPDVVSPIHHFVSAECDDERSDGSDDNEDNESVEEVAAAHERLVTRSRDLKVAPPDLDPGYAMVIGTAIEFLFSTTLHVAFHQRIAWVVFVAWNCCKWPVFFSEYSKYCNCGCLGSDKPKKTNLPGPATDGEKSLLNSGTNSVMSAKVWRLRIIGILLSIIPFVWYLPWVMQQCLSDCVYAQTNHTVGHQVVANVGIVDCNEDAIAMWDSWMHLRKGSVSEMMQMTVQAGIPFYIVFLYFKSHHELDSMFEIHGVHALQLLVLDVLDVCHFMGEAFQPASFAYLKASPNASVLLVFAIMAAWSTLIGGTVQMMLKSDGWDTFAFFNWLSFVFDDLALFVFRAGSLYHGLTLPMLFMGKNIMCGVMKFSNTCAGEDNHVSLKILQFALMLPGSEEAKRRMQRQKDASVAQEIEAAAEEHNQLVDDWNNLAEVNDQLEADKDKLEDLVQALQSSQSQHAPPAGVPVMPRVAQPKQKKRKLAKKKGGFCS